MIEQSRTQHAEDLIEKNRLLKMVDDKVNVIGFELLISHFLHWSVVSMTFAIF